MRYFNADGQPAELCLNGTRCALRLATHLGWGGSDTIRIETDAGIFKGWQDDPGSVTLELPRPGTAERVDLAHDDEIHAGWYLVVGVPHFVLPWAESLSRAPVADLGPPLRRHLRWGQDGANINFVRYTGPHRLEIRTFERGVEAETLACGSGVMAAAQVGLMTGALELPVKAQTLGGFELRVGSARSSDSDDLWSLSGDARLVSEGTLQPGSLTVPSPPSWTP